MKTVKQLFDPKKDIHRTIEKVITYNASQGARLKAEITEYIVTENIDDQFERLISKMQLAMETGGQNEIGVWVSGFYGSGKSSFTKYLGLALDDRAENRIDGVPFLKHLQDRLLKSQTKALLGTVAEKYKAAVVMLDLASSMLAGATMEEVSSVLYYKSLQWAGYSRNLKVAAFERKVEKDGRKQEFLDKIQSQLDMSWAEVQNDPLVVDSIVPEIAHEMYPHQFKTPTSFNTETSDIIQFENERVKEMIDIVRQTSGRDYVIFIIDEVGQYVGSRDNLILNLDGLAKNLKSIGEGKVWIIGTAQQTLTEDDPRAALNSDKLYKLKDRFPIQIDLESSDIREICYRRLLGKSSEGEAVLGGLFDKAGPALRQNTKLQDARYYDADFDKSTFVNLYPFLPAHFDILLHLLGALAKSTGGIGLRSAIKVIQDILVEGPDGRSPVAEQPIGWLATTVTLYDMLEKDIQRSFQSIHKAVGKVLLRFTEPNCIQQQAAKTIAVLQILGNMPVTIRNVAALMHPSIEAPGRVEDVEKAISDMINDAIVPLGEKEGNLCFFSEKLNDIERERVEYHLRTIELRRIHNDALKEALSPLASVRINGTLAVSTGLKIKSGNAISSLVGEREPVQTIVEFVAPVDYDTALTKAVDESRVRTSQNYIYLLGRQSAEIDDKVAEIFRCREVVTKHRGDADQEVKDYCNGQTDRANRLEEELQKLLTKSLMMGSFVFRADTTAVSTVDDKDLLEACKKHLTKVGTAVFDRYDEAPHRAETDLAEKFLRVGNLRAVTTKVDPLNLVQIVGGTPKVHSDHKALVSIRDFIDKHGTVDGKRLIAQFTSDPFGWSPDTLRYLIAAMLVGGDLKLRVSGREVTVNGQQAIEALRTINTFKPVGVSLREGKPPTELLAKASERLTELIGDTVLPLEDELSKAVTKHFPQFQHRYAPLAEKLDRLSVPGGETVRTVMQEIANLLLTDASDAPSALGSQESSIYDGLIWAREVSKSLDNGLEKTLSDLARHIREIDQLPKSGMPGRLREDLSESIDHAKQRIGQDDFCKHAADLASTLTSIQAATRDTAIAMAGEQKRVITEAQSDLQNLPDWKELTQEEQSTALSQVENLMIDTAEDLSGLKARITQDFVIGSRVSELKRGIEQTGNQRRRERLEHEKEKAKQAGKTKLSRSVKVPKKVTGANQIDDLISNLQLVREEVAVYDDIEITIEFES
jgi:effector-binding domain-containing protein